MDEFEASLLESNENYLGPLDQRMKQQGDFSSWDATILLTSRAIGTGFLFFPSHQLYGPFILSMMLESLT